MKIKERAVRLYDNRTTKVSTTTLAQVGRAVEKLLELPPSTLEQHRNKFVHVHSFNVSQMDMLRALEKATGTTEADWNIKKVPVDEAIANGKAEFGKGNRMGMVDVLYGIKLQAGDGWQLRGKDLERSSGAGRRGS